MSEAQHAIDAVDWAYATGKLDPTDGYDLTTASTEHEAHPAREGTASPQTFRGLLTLPQPHCTPFRRMLTCPVVIERLEWLMGPGLHLANGIVPAVRLMVKGNAGQMLHAGLNENHKDYHYSLHHSGRVYNEQVNVSYQLCKSCADGGGLIVVPGGHKANYQMPARMQLCQVSLDTKFILFTSRPPPFIAAPRH